MPPIKRNTTKLLKLVKKTKSPLDFIALIRLGGVVPTEEDDFTFLLGRLIENFESLSAANQKDFLRAYSKHLKKFSS